MLLDATTIIHVTPPSQQGQSRGDGAVLHRRDHRGATLRFMMKTLAEAHYRNVVCLRVSNGRRFRSMNIEAVL
jgi:hypothetical protein